MGQENCGTDQTHYCRHCLKHCQFLYATARQKTAATLHSQKDFRAMTYNADRPRILRNRRASTCDPAPRIWDFAPKFPADVKDRGSLPNANCGRTLNSIKRSVVSNGEKRMVTKWMAIFVSTIVLACADLANAAELPTYELMGFPITPHQFSVLGSANVQEASRAPTLMLRGMPASPHQIAVLTPHKKGLAANSTQTSVHRGATD